MVWVLFAIGAALSWGLYGVMLYRGQVMLANPMKALLCVGMADAVASPNASAHTTFLVR